ncbi:ABC transporter ATP-binding protein [Marinimicrobium alkaliphilum]|uniref:ABC transporter ATP-binding protein n=1 Tax=Marinimicrobium alkaliphilum TaxID=2202654 RepID=UPI000DBAA11D|nr:ABC transporter ATP-binding protein [Marinimicrobium alkaliphilum]
MDKSARNSVPEPAIALRDVSFGWSRSAPPLLRIESLAIARGERVFLYGPSGSGKTSLLNLLAGVNLPQSGDITLLGEKLNRLSGRKRDRFRARHIGVVFQQFNLIPYLSVLDNVLLAAHFARLPGPESHARARELLAHLGLEDALATRPARTLSVGQQQRVAVARALVAEPEILLADEPTSALDSDTRDAFIELLLASAARNNTTLVFVSHDRALQPHFSRALDVRELVHQGETA